MNEKQIILEIPVLSQSYEIKIPSDMKISLLRLLLAESIQELTNGQYVSSGEEILYLKNRHEQLSEDQEVRFYNIQNGDVILIF